MQPVNDDMDELYKRAAENYPLNTDSADWDAVVKKMSPGQFADPAASSKNKNYRHLLWLLLLLPLGLLYKNFSGDKPDHPAPINPASNISKKVSPGIPVPKQTGPVITSVQPVDVKPNISVVQVNSSSVQVNSSSFVQRKLKGKLNSIITENNSTKTIPDNTVSHISNSADDLKRKNEAVSDINKDVAETKTEPTINAEDKKADNIFTDKAEIIKSPKKKVETEREHGLYLGIIVSPDISSVKFQSIKNIGISMGVLAGYQINKKISIESGVSWDIKNYHSDAEYFSTNNIPMPSGAKIKNVDGECHMIEIPVTVKYNFKRSGKNIFSVSAGVSSYIMKKEYYDYQVDRNGQQYPYSSTYKNTSRDLFAVANFAVGYNHQVKKGLTLRLEPYLKVPLKGVGIGSLPIMSSGVNIGIAKKISR